MRRILVSLAAALISAWFAPASLSAAQADSDLAILQQRDAKLFAIGWHLTRANAPFCRETVPSIGLLLHDAAAYADAETVRGELGLSGDIGIQAVAPGSPAEGAGLRANATLVAVNELAVDELPATDPTWQRLTRLQDAIDTELASPQPATVSWRGAGGAASQAQIAPVATCRTRFEVLSSGDRALAEGTRVIFGVDFAGFTYPDDEFAAAVAHELAHNLLAHRAQLDITGRGQSSVRLTEREADRLMPWLLHNAGYDPNAAVRFMERWGPRHGGGLFRKRTHDGWDERVEFITAEIAAMQSVIDETGAADWSVHFRREDVGG